MLVGMMMMFTSCTDFVEPRIPYTDFNTGLYLRTLARQSTSFDLFNLGTSRFEIDIEAVDADGGRSIQNVVVSVRHRRLIPGVGNQYIPSGTATQVNDVVVKTLSASEFSSNPESRFIGSKITVTTPEVLTALGMTQAQVQARDVFEFRLEATDVNGRVFNDVNASPDVKGGLFYASPFLYPVEVVCPLLSTFAVGQYNLAQTSGPGDPFFGNATRFVSEVVTLAVGNFNTQRIFPIKYLGGNFSNSAFSINFSCGQILKPAQGPGVGCTAGNPIIWSTNNSDIPTYELGTTDDSVIVIRIIDDANGSCGALANAPVELTLTKL